MEQKQPIDIVLTIWGREPMTQSCIAAIEKNTTTPYRLIIVDNGSQNWLQQGLVMKKNSIYVKLDKNYGLEYAKHIGMQFVESPLFVSTDNDILPYSYNSDWLSQLITLMNNNPEYGAIALKPQILVGTGMQMFETDKDIVEFPHVPGYCRIMRTDLVKKVGAWSDKRPLRGHEELWIGEKFRDMGVKMGWANNIRCWHLFGNEDTDEWGYLKGSKPEDHGHNPVWPMPKNDQEEIERNVGVWVTR